MQNNLQSATSGTTTSQAAVNNTMNNNSNSQASDTVVSSGNSNAGVGVNSVGGNNTNGGGRMDRKQGGKGGGNNGAHNGKSSGPSVNNSSNNSRNQLKSVTPSGMGPGPNNVNPNAFLGSAAMMNMSPYMNMNSMTAAAARIQQANQVASAAACMSPYMNLRYPQLVAPAPIAPSYSTLAAAAAAAHGQHQHVSGYSVYQGNNRMPASSPPVSVSSGGSSTSGLGSSASSSSTSANSGVNGAGTPGINTVQTNGQPLNTGNGSGGGGAGTPSSVSGSQIGEQLSRTNLYIRGLPQNTTDKDLMSLCGQYGTIISTKAILDKNTNKCKGYGFVDFESPMAAETAVKQLQAQGIQAQMAKVRQTYSHHHLLLLPAVLENLF